VAPSGRTSGSHFSGLAAPPLRNNQNVSKPKKQVEKEAESKVVTKTNKTGKKQAKAKAKKS